MKILPKILLMSTLCCFAMRTAALPVIGTDAQKLSKIFFTLMKDYGSALTIALKTKNPAELTDFVEKDSPWMKTLERSKERGDFGPPHIGGEIAFRSFPQFQYNFFHNKFSDQREQIIITQHDLKNDIYIFEIPGSRIAVRFKKKQMKFYEFKSEELLDAYQQQFL